MNCFRLNLVFFEIFIKDSDSVRIFDGFGRIRISPNPLDSAESESESEYSVDHYLEMNADLNVIGKCAVIADHKSQITGIFLFWNIG